jgi:hypothetical protein
MVQHVNFRATSKQRDGHVAVLVYGSSGQPMIEREALTLDAAMGKLSKEIALYLDHERFTISLDAA